MVSDVYVSNTLLHTAYTSARRVCMHARYPSCGDGCTMAVYVSVSLQNSGEERRVAAAKRNAGVRSCARPLDQRFFPSLLFFSSSFSSSSLFFLPFISFFRRSIDTDHLFWIIFTGVRAFPPPPLAKKWEFTRTGAWLSGKFCREPTTSANEHDTKKRIRPCNRAIFVAPSTWRKKEGSVCIYIYVFYIYICIFCSIGRRSGAILEIM